MGFYQYFKETPINTGLQPFRKKTNMRAKVLIEDGFCINIVSSFKYITYLKMSFDVYFEEND